MRRNVTIWRPGLERSCNLNKFRCNSDNLCSEPGLRLQFFCEKHPGWTTVVESPAMVCNEFFHQNKTNVSEYQWSQPHNTLMLWVIIILMQVLAPEQWRWCLSPSPPSSEASCSLPSIQQWCWRSRIQTLPEQQPSEKILNSILSIIVR